MKSASAESGSHRMGAPQNRCVWMEAGVLSYLLCDREFECDRCPLDEAMRSHFPAGGAKTVRSARSAGETDRCEDRPSDPASRYLPGHLRIDASGDRVYRLSLDRELAEILPPIRSIILPAAGDRVRAESFCAWLIFEGGTLPVKLPFGITVSGPNPRLTQHPHIVKTGAPGEEWLFEFSPADPPEMQRTVLGPAEAGEKFVSDRDTFRRLALECLQGERTTGTLYDGGRVVDDLAGMIGPVKYLQILRRVFWSGPDDT